MCGPRYAKEIKHLWRTELWEEDLGEAVVLEQAVAGQAGEEIGTRVAVGARHPRSSEVVEKARGCRAIAWPAGSHARSKRGGARRGTPDRANPSSPHGLLCPAAAAASFPLGDSCFTAAGFTRSFSRPEPSAPQAFTVSGELPATVDRASALLRAGRFSLAQPPKRGVPSGKGWLGFRQPVWSICHCAPR